jgi:hypothetical protein
MLIRNHNLVSSTLSRVSELPVFRNCLARATAPSSVCRSLLIYGKFAYFDMTKRWSDFLFAIGVRSLCGLVIGGLAGLLFGWRAILERAARDDMRFVVLWLSTWALAGGLVAMLRIPHWLKPGYKGVRDPDQQQATSSDEKFGPIDPENYNRLTHLSQKHFHDFVEWLRETTLSELERTRGDLAATRAVFLRFFQRGLRADLLLGELMDIMPSILNRAHYAGPERAEVIAMLKAMSLEELGVRRDEQGARFEDPAA